MPLILVIVMRSTALDAFGTAMLCANSASNEAYGAVLNLCAEHSGRLAGCEPGAFELNDMPASYRLPDVRMPPIGEKLAST
jgi:hypothetical protein